MKIVLLQDVPRVGKRGEIKEVADGFGRNFLLPQKLATLATPAALEMTEAQRQVAERQRQRSEEELRDLAQKLAGIAVTVKAKAGAENRIFGSVKNLHIARELSHLAGFEIDKRTIELAEPIRQLGTYEIRVRLAKDMAPKIKVIVEGGKE